MNEKSATGGSRNAAAAAAQPGGAVPTQPPPGQTEPAIDLILEEVRADDPVGGQAALRVPNQPERLDVLLADLLDDEVDDVLQVLVVRRRPRPRRGVWGGDDQAVFVLVVHDREIVALPVPV